MSITRIEAFPLRYPEPHDSNKLRHVTLVRIESAGGLVGWGECISQWFEAGPAVKTIVERGLAPLLIGQDPLNVEDHWQRMREHSFWYGNGGIAAFAISAIDTALWDLKGKLLSAPLYQLLGGRRRPQIRACASVIFDTENLDRTAEEFADYRKRGYTAVKGGWGKSPDKAFGLDPKRDLTLVRVIRDAIGDDVDLVIDVGTHVRWTPSHAIKMARAFEPFNLYWIEEPLPPEDLAGYRRLHAAIHTPIATGEKEATFRGFRDLIRSGGVDIVMPDVGKAEGVTGVRRVLEAAEMDGVKFTMHSWSSAINTAASIHLYASAPNGTVFELKPDANPMQHELVDRPFEQKAGYVELPEGPGLGITVNEDVVRKYLYS